MAEMAKDESQLVHGTAVADSIGGKLGESQLGQKLLDEDDESYGGDEAAQERLGQHAVEEAQSKQARQENGGASGAGDDAAYFGMHESIVVGASTVVYTALYDAADKQGAGSLGAEDHLRGAAEHGVDEGVEDEGVQAVDGRHMGEGVGEGQGHGQIHPGEGQGGDQVAFEEGQLVLAHPDEAGQIVREVPGGRSTCQSWSQGGEYGHMKTLTHMKALSLTPCLSASSLEVLMALLLIRRAHRFRQSEAPLAATKATTLSMMGNELSDEAPGESAPEPVRLKLLRPRSSRRLPEGLAGYGEKVP